MTHVDDTAHRAGPGASKPILQLYISRGCGYCYRVLRVIDELGIDVKLRDIHADRHALGELISARGRATVPVLRRIDASGDHYMPESADIIQYLRTSYPPGPKAARE